MPWRPPMQGWPISFANWPHALLLHASNSHARAVTASAPRSAMRSTAPRGGPRSRSCDRSAANACRTRGLGLRARAGVPALLDRIRTDSELISKGLSAWVASGSRPARRSRMPWLCGTKRRPSRGGVGLPSSEPQQAPSLPCHARGAPSAGTCPSSLVGGHLSRGRRMHVAASEKPPGGSARRSGVPRSCGGSVSRPPWESLPR